jgi:hypothetical protein
MEAIKAQVRTTSDLDLAREAIDQLLVYHQRAVPALCDIIHDCSIKEIRDYIVEQSKS